MKTLILTAALAASLAAPALASDQLAERLGVEPGRFTTAELVRLDRALENDEYAYVNFLLSGGSNTAGLTEAGAAFQARLFAEGDEFHRANAAGPGGVEVISSQSFGATDAARAFAIAQAEQNGDWSRLHFLRNGGGLN